MNDEIKFFDAEWWQTKIINKSKEDKTNFHYIQLTYITIYMYIIVLKYTTTNDYWITSYYNTYII